MNQNTGLIKFLKTALLPAHSTMYIWGGGWSPDDSCAGEDGTRLGVNPNWRKFYEAQGSDYDFKQHKFEYGNGLDCSGYVGWAVYNYFGGGKTGYVNHAKNQGRMFAEMGFGEYHPKMIELMPGDIVSSIDHVYITVARCADGSIILLHSSPPGVQLCGTVTPRGGRVGIADSLVKEYTKRFYPDWYRKFSYCSRGAAYLRDCGVFRWHDAVMPDPCGLKNMPPERILKILFT